MTTIKSISVSLETYFDTLWPINRTIMGPGIEESFQIIDKVFNFSFIKLNTGDIALDWIVPKAWKVRTGHIRELSGKKIIDISDNNLHVVSHSESFKGIVPLSKLKEHIFTLPEQTDAIPYVTSYYEKNWGFCMSQKTLEAMTDEEYFVEIDAEHYDGKLVIGEKIIGSKNEPFVCFSSYLCHPSMANNELSGPLVLMHLFKELSKIQLKNSYRFYIFPETIGSVGLLAKQKEDFKNLLVAGYHLSCIGDGGEHTIKTPRRKHTFSETAVRQEFSEETSKYVSFDPAFGSDERQFCSPGFNLPYCGISRTIYAEFPEYHTSLDNKALMNFEKMAETVLKLKNLVLFFEKFPSEMHQKFLRVNPEGEPQLSRKKLFRSLSTKTRTSDELLMWWVLNYCDGVHSILDIAMLSGFSPDKVLSCCVMLVEEGLLLGK